MAKVIIYISFLFLLSWTYYTEESAGKCHVTSVTVTASGHMIGMEK